MRIIDIAFEYCFESQEVFTRASKAIPSSKYAVFTHKGPISTLKNTYDFIYASWLPNSAYELAELDTIELYDSRSSDCTSPYYEFDIYIPVK